MVDKKIIYIVIGILVVIAAIYLFLPRESSVESGEIQSEPVGNWINIELSNVATGEKFRVSDFSDKPVLLESFAVWCPTCTQQQKVTKNLEEEVGDSIVSISIDTDPNEDEARVQKHIDDNGFNWYYAISPIEFTQSLIDQFGIDIVNAPSAPMVLICDGQKARQLGSGVKSVEKLKEEVARGC